MLLNQAQQRAVESESKRIAVIAAAGSGKTRVLIERIFDLIRNKGVNPGTILTITFTKKAAGELRTRLERMDITGVKAYTFHSFCYSIINGYATRLGYRFPVNAYDEYLSTSIFVDIMISYNLPYGNPVKNEKIRTASTKIVKNAIDKIYNEKPDEWIRIDEEYHKRLKSYNAVDYSMMISETVRLLNQNPDVCSEIHNAWHHLLIDEFQDTDPAQMELIDLINPKNLFIIGDIDQSIFGFRSATPENVFRVVESGDCELIHLNTNYRCASKIIEHSNLLISHNPNRLRIDAEPTDDAEPGICQVRTGQMEAWTQAAVLVKSLLNNYKPNEIAVLCRDNGRETYPVGCYGVAENLKALNIPHKRIVRDGSLWDSPTVRNMIYTLNLILNPRDRASWSMAVNFPFMRTSPATRAFIRQKATHDRLTLLEASVNYDTTREWAKSIITLNNLYLEMNIGNQDESCSEFFSKVVNELKWTTWYRPLTGRLIDIIISRIVLQMKVLAQGGYPTIQDFIEWWLSREAIAESPNLNAVEVSTIHSYKGLEKRVVIIPGLDSTHFPKVSKAGLDLEEECRIFYVAITRAEEECYILYQNEPSIFVEWAGFGDNDNNDNNKMPDAELEEQFL